MSRLAGKGRAFAVALAVFLSTALFAQKKVSSLTASPSQNLESADSNRPIYLADDSDWWSMLRSVDSDENVLQQKRDPPPGNLRILGVDLRHNWRMSQVLPKFGPTTTVQRGDAATGRAQVCYESKAGRDHVRLIFEEGEVEECYYLFAQGPHWKGETSCTPSKLVSANARNDAGLGLGETRQQIIALLGKPSLISPDRLVYIFALEKKTPAKEFEDYRKAHPEMDEKQAEENGGSYALWVEIRVRFQGSKSSYIGVLWSATN